LVISYIAPSLRHKGRGWGWVFKPQREGVGDGFINKIRGMLGMGLQTANEKGWGWV